MNVQAVNELGEVQDDVLLVRYGSTPEDWEKASNDMRFVEFIDGRLIMHSPISLTHSRIGIFLQSLLNLYIERNDLGELLAGPFAMDLGLTRKFEPDLLFLATENAATLREDRLEGPADLAIEIASPSTRSYDRQEKRECYHVGGVREYWMIDPYDRVVIVDRPAGNEIARSASAWVESSTCAGFRVRAEWLWRVPLPRVDACLQEIEVASGEGGKAG